MRTGKQYLRRYSLALLASAGALLLRWLLDPFIGLHNAYLTMWLALVFSAWYCGPGPAFATLTSGLAGISYWFMAPVHSFHIQSLTELYGMLGFTVLGTIIILLGESSRRGIRKREQAEEGLRKMHDHLETLVRDRTLALQHLSGRILTLQDEERRRIARGLHDSLGQYLSALKMDLDLMALSDDRRDTLLTECSDIVKQCLTETRTLSYLLHPPLLDEAGFASAARWFVQGFAERSGIQINLNFPVRIERMHSDVEVSLFRAVQEALTNIHRHSGASLVEISFAVESERIRVEIKDNGRGIPPHRLRSGMDGNAPAGVGIAGMRERVRELEGSLEIHSDARGTSFIVSIPSEKAFPESAKEASMSFTAV